MRQLVAAAQRALIELAAPGKDVAAADLAERCGCLMPANAIKHVKAALSVKISAL